MELRHLRYFVAVAEELHFRRAAERLHVAQPAVSEQIRKLEQELGVRLLDRTQRKVALTAAGNALLDEARQVLRDAETAQHAARAAGNHAATRLRLGHMCDSLPVRIPRALRYLAASVPHIDVDLATGAALRLIEDVRARRLDAVVTSMPAPTNGLRVTHAGEQGAVVALPASHPCAPADGLDLAELAPQRLVVLPREADPAFHHAIAALCHATDLSPAFVEVREPRVEHVLLAVTAGAGLAVLPESAKDRYASPGVRFVPLHRGQVVVRSAVLTLPDTENLATLALLRALARTATDAPVWGHEAVRLAA
jgi:DNA-binding transcriptional LysR family regulator